MADYKAAWRIRTREWAIELLGGKCANCGAIDSLEFDHVDPATKEKEISVAIRDGWGKARLAVELAKCQLLCGECHEAKTNDPRRAAREHGTWGMYSNAGCRCDLCREVFNRYQREYRRRRKVTQQ